MKRAYENWGQVVEYDGKVLTALTALTDNKKVTRSSSTPVVDHGHVGDHYVRTASPSQNHIPSDLSSQCQRENDHSSARQLIEYPFVRSDPTIEMALATPQTALSSSLDYMSAGTSAMGNPYLSGDWSRSRNGQGLEDFFSEEIRLRSSEMLESDDMQRMLKTFNMSVDAGMGPAFGHSDNACYSYSLPYERPMEHGRGTGKAVVGWLKLRAALRWGIFIRKKAAERRAQLVELD